MSEKRLVIFDLDNTLIINRPAAKEAYTVAIRYICKETKLKFDKVWNHWKKIVAKLKQNAEPEKRGLEYSLNQLLMARKLGSFLISPAIKLFEKELLAKIRLVPGAKELVSWLKEEKALIAVSAATDRTVARKKLKVMDLYKYLDMLLTASDVGVMKPHPNYYQLILDELKVTKEQTMVISESKVEDILVAKNMGIKAILIPAHNAHLTALKPQLAEFLSFAK